MDLARLVPAGGILRRFLSTPAIHFIVIGGLLFGAERLWRKSGDGAIREPLVVPASRIERVREEFRSSYARSPDPIEDQALIDKAIEEEVLYRRALAIGLDRGNRFVRDRLLTLMGYLADDPRRADEALLEEAYALGLDRSDIVIRRGLIETMRLIATRPGAADPASEDELRAAYEGNADLFRKPARIRLSQVFFSRDRRGGSLAADAETAIRHLQAGRVDPASAVLPGDPFLYGNDLPLLSEPDLERRLGSGLVKALVGQPEGEWIGPLESAYGLHLVWIHERRPGEILPFESVRARLEHLVRHERSEERARQSIAEWRNAYDIHVELPGSARAASRGDGGLG